MLGRAYGYVHNWECEEHRVNSRKRRAIEGWIDKASNHLRAAKDHLETRTRHSEVVEAAQECIELSVKSILSLLHIKYSPSHGWEQDKKQFAAIAEQIQDRELLDKLAAYYLDSAIPLPRLLFLVNFWAQFYITAKYGFEVGNLASAQDLIRIEEAELAVKHAKECYRAVSALRYLDEDKLMSLLHQAENAASRQG